MAMNDFIVVVPPYWLEVQNARELMYNYGEEGWQHLVNSQSWSAIDAYMEDNGYRPAGFEVIDARILDLGAAAGDGRWRFWVQLQQQPG